MFLRSTNARDAPVPTTIVSLDPPLPTPPPTHRRHRRRRRSDTAFFSPPSERAAATDTRVPPPSRHPPRRHRPVHVRPIAAGVTFYDGPRAGGRPGSVPNDGGRRRWGTDGRRAAGVVPRTLSLYGGGVATGPAPDPYTDKMRASRTRARSTPGAKTAEPRDVGLPTSKAAEKTETRALHVQRTHPAAGLLRCRRRRTTRAGNVSAGRPAIHGHGVSSPSENRRVNYV